MLDLIRREKIYILMFIFILAVNFMNTSQAKKESVDDEKSLSSITFQELGVTEEKVKDFFESGKPGALFFKYAVSLGFFIFLAALLSNLVFIFRKKKISFKGLCSSSSWVGGKLVSFFLN